MVRPLTVVEEMISLFTGTSGQKKWFTRKMKELPPDQQEAVWEALERKGHSRPQEREAPSRVIITWTEEEWDKLTDAVWRVRKNNPSDSLVGLVRTALAQFPENRRRNIRVVAELKPLVDRLTVRDEALLHGLAEKENLLQQKAEKEQQIEDLRGQLEQANQRYRDDLARVPNRDEILGTMTDEEVLHHFQQRVLTLLPPDEVLSHYQSESLISYVPFSEMVAHVVKTSHAMWDHAKRKVAGTATKLVVHHGGIDTMVRKLDSILPQPVLV